MKKLLVVLAAAFVAAGAASAERAAAKDCGVVSGPRYVLLGASKKEYMVTTEGVRCRFGVIWMRRLASSRISAPFPLLEGGPAGWSCRAVKMQGTRTAALGSCINGSRTFTWLPSPSETD